LLRHSEPHLPGGLDVSPSLCSCLLFFPLRGLLSPLPARFIAGRGQLGHSVGTPPPNLAFFLGLLLLSASAHFATSALSRLSCFFFPAEVKPVPASFLFTPLFFSFVVFLVVLWCGKKRPYFFLAAEELILFFSRVYGPLDNWCFLSLCVLFAGFGNPLLKRSAHFLSRSEVRFSFSTSLLSPYSQSDGLSCAFSFLAFSVLWTARLFFLCCVFQIQVFSPSFPALADRFELFFCFLPMVFREGSLFPTLWFFTRPIASPQQNSLG